MSESSGGSEGAATRPRRSPLGRGVIALLLIAPIVIVITTARTATTPAPPTAPAATSLRDVVPAPVSVAPATGVTYTLPPTAAIHADDGASDVAEQLAALLRPSTGYELPVVDASGEPADGISLLLSGAGSRVGEEGYQLDVTDAAVVLRAKTPTGLFRGVQTLRQLLPPAVERPAEQPGPWVVPGGRIIDHPRFAYRGAMLDVARHFQPVSTVKRYIDQLALYKINHLHLHLTDDQGWRIAIESWPRLTEHGGSTEAGGGPGGHYSKAGYREIVSYARSRHITVVPEIDMPGHTTAALASYPELNCDGVAPPLYTGTSVGFSSLCVPKEITYDFVEDVLSELIALTPGPYVHVGGDEAHATPQAEYNAFANRVQPMVADRERAVIGWHQLSEAEHSDGRVLQYWGDHGASDPAVTDAVSQGARVLMSPADKAYLDMKYTSSAPLGTDWAGYTEVRDAYQWNPGASVAGVPESAVLGVEAPLWTETVETPANLDYLAFPRLPAIAELGWSPWSSHDWDAFSRRLAAQGVRWDAMGIDYYRSPQVPWR